MQIQQAQVDAVKADIAKSNSAIAKANVGTKTAERYVYYIGKLDRK